MSSEDISVWTVIVPNPDSRSYDNYVQIVNSSLGYNYADFDHFQVLSTNNPSGNDVLGGLFYLPNLTPSGVCNNTGSLIPANVTRISDIPSGGYPLVGLVPWTSPTCVQLYLESMRDNQVQAAVFFHNDQSGNLPPPASDPSWDLGDGGKWKRNPFPIFAVPGAVGATLMQELGLYNGNMTDVPFGDKLVKIYDSRAFVRLWARIDLNPQPSIPSLWVFLVMVLGILLGLVLITSVIMHVVQARQRRALRRRVVNGEINLEALGIKRLNVPQSILDKMPQYVFTSKAETDAAALNPNLTDQKRSQGVSKANPPREVPFSQPTCPICLEDFQHNETIIRELPCSHVFHPECIDPFLRENSSLCPICKKSTLPPGYCPVRVTNLMVRRERLIRRMRERAPADEENGPMTPGQRLSAVVGGISQRMRRASTSLSYTPNRLSTLSAGATSEMGTVRPPTTPALPITGVVRDAPPPEIQRRGTEARRSWRRQRVASVVQRSYEDRENGLSRPQPAWRRVAGTILPALNTNT